MEVSPPVFLISSGTIASILFGWFIYREYKETSVKISPVLVLFIIPFLMLGVTSIYQGFVFFGQEYVPIGPKYTTTTSVVMGYIMVATGLFFQFLGIIFFRPKSVLKTNFLDIKSNVNLVPYFILFLLISKYLEFNFSIGVLQTFLNLVPFSILFFIAITDKKNISVSYRYKRNVVVLGSIVLFLVSLVSLSKTNNLLSIMPVFVFYLIHAKKFQKFKIFAVFGVISLTYLFFIQPLVSNARIAFNTNKEQVSYSEISDYIISGNYKYSSTKDMESNKYNAVEILLNRIFEIGAPAFIYDIVKTSGFQYGSTFHNMVYALVPRLIWRDKPLMTQGAKFAGKYFNQPGNNIGMLISGELYWNYGFIGIIIGSFILGLAIGFLWRLITPLAFTNFIYFTIYFYLLQSCLGGSEFTAVFMGVVQTLVIFIIIRFLDKFFFRQTLYVFR